MATQRSIIVGSVAWGLSLALPACGATQQASTKVGLETDALTNAIVARDGTRVEELTNEVLAGRRNLDPRMLTDERPAAWPNLPATIDNRFQQLGVERVSDYALCLLELQHRTSSADILSIVAPAKRQVCTIAATPGRAGCEVCNSQAFPVPGDVRAELANDWLSRGLK